MLTYKFVFRKVNPKDKDGYIFIQFIENRRKTYKSLGLPKLNEKLWNSEIQRVSKSKNIDHEHYNKIIIDKLKDLLVSDLNIESIEGKKSRKSFLIYFEQVVINERLKHQHGTRIKYKVVLDKLKKNLVTKNNQVDLPFSEITINFLNQFKNYLIEDGLKRNTVNHYLKILKGIINRAQKEGFYRYHSNPYDQFVFFRREPTRKDIPFTEDLKKLIKFKFKNPYLDKYRDYFLFQLFANGMRFSDLSLLRFKNLSNGRISYSMFKTKSVVDFPINENQIKILNKYIGIDTKSIIETTTLSGKRIDETTFAHKMILEYDVKVQNQKKKISPFNPTLPTLPTLLKLSNQFIGPINPYQEFLNSSNIDSLKNELFRLNFHTTKIQIKGRLNEMLTQIPIIENKITQLESKISDLYLRELNKFSRDHKTMNKFVFPILSSDFNMESPNLIDEKSYKEIRHKTVVYNRNLKLIAIEVGLNVTLTSHSPRHLFTSILMGMENVNIYDISKSLGHSDIKITENYIQNGFNLEKLDRINTSISNLFK